MKPQVVGNQNILLRTVKHTEAALNTLWYYAKLHIIIYTITIKNYFDDISHSNFNRVSPFIFCTSFEPSRVPLQQKDLTQLILYNKSWMVKQKQNAKMRNGLVTLSEIFW